jgi:acyl carrier protein
MLTDMPPDHGQVYAIVAELNLLTDAGALKQPLDSLDVVNLYVELEGRLNITIPPEEISPENFGSIEQLVGLVKRCR